MKDITNAPNLKAQFSQVTEYWSPKIIGELDDSYLKIAKLKGEFVWHDHELEDELFFIVKGSMQLEFDDQLMQLNEGDFYVVPKATMHKPYAEEECWVMLIEKKSTAHTGTVITDKTKSIEEQK